VPILFLALGSSLTLLHLRNREYMQQYVCIEVLDQVTAKPFGLLHMKIFLKCYVRIRLGLHVLYLYRALIKILFWWTTFILLHQLFLKRKKIHLENFQSALIKYSSLEEQLERFLSPQITALLRLKDKLQTSFII